MSVYMNYRHICACGIIDLYISISRINIYKWTYVHIYAWFIRYQPLILWGTKSKFSATLEASTLIGQLRYSFPFVNDDWSKKYGCGCFRIIHSLIHSFVHVNTIGFFLSSHHIHLSNLDHDADHIFGVRSEVWLALDRTINSQKHLHHGDTIVPRG